VHSLSKGTSDLYKGNVVDTTNSQASSSNRNMAAYIQVGKTFFNRLTISAGARYEHFSIQSPRISDTAAVSIIREGKPVVRAGANLKIHKATFLRASFGQGYRFPTIAEKFIKTAVGPIQIYPNDSITSETSWNVEVGLKQGFKIGNFLGYADVAWFQSNFKNNIEFNFGQFGTFSDPLFGLGFASLNIGNTKVSGIDASIAGQGKIGKTNIALLTGYTYTVPVTLQPNLPYPVQLNGKQLTYSASSSDSTGNLLKYRFQHLFKFDIEFTRGKWTFGFSSRYNSNMQNIDKIFEDLDFILAALGQQSPGLTDYRARNNDGFTIFDARLSFQLSEMSRIAFVVNNLTNEQYSIRPLKMEEPRTTAIQLNVSF